MPKGDIRTAWAEFLQAHYREQCVPVTIHGIAAEWRLSKVTPGKIIIFLDFQCYFPSSDMLFHDDLAVEWLEDRSQLQICSLFNAHINPPYTGVFEKELLMNWVPYCKHECSLPAVYIAFDLTNVLINRDYPGIDN
jgi:hypothetical protein